MPLSEDEVRRLRREVGVPLDTPNVKPRVYRKGQPAVTLDDARAVLARMPGRPQVELARELNVSQPYMSHLMKKLRAQLKTKVRGTNVNENELNISRECNPDNMRLFVAALRSGDFQQVKGELRIEHTVFNADGDVVVNGVGYCCLGVATEVAIKNGIELKPQDFGYITTATNPLVDLLDLGENHFTGVLPYPVKQWLGVENPDPYLLYSSNPDSEARSATTLNDDSDFTLAQIADAFERTFLPGDVQPSASE